MSKPDAVTSQRTDDRLETLVADRQVLVASNRQPYSCEYDEEGSVAVNRPTGGLTAGLDPVMQRVGDTWIAWSDGDADGETSDFQSASRRTMTR